MITVIWQHRFDQGVHGRVVVRPEEVRGMIQHIEARGPYRAVVTGAHR